MAVIVLPCIASIVYHSAAVVFRSDDVSTLKMYLSTSTKYSSNNVLISTKYKYKYISTY